MKLSRDNAGWHALDKESREQEPRVLPANWIKMPPEMMEIGGCYLRRDNLKVIMSVERKGDDPKIWLHVSCSRENGLPSWQDVHDVKILFIGKARTALQILPPEAEYVNFNPNVLHIWCCLNSDILPDFRRYGIL